MSNSIYAGGWVRLHRNLLDNPHAKDPDWVAVWVFMLLNAEYHAKGHKPKDVLFNGERYQLAPGQFVSSVREIAENTGVNRSKVERIIFLMKSETQIETQGSNKNTVFTVMKWRLYQNSETPTDTPVRHK